MKRAQSEQQVPRDIPAAVRPTRIFHVLAGVSHRRVRGASLLASLLLSVVVASLVAFSVLPWWSIPVAATVLVVDVAWLRHRGLSERAARRAKPSSRETVADPVHSARRDPAEPEPAEPGSESESGRDLVAPPVAGWVAEEPELPVTESEALVEVPVEADPSGWDPIPVPPPTYTLKAKAAPRVPVVVPDFTPGQFLSLDGLVYDCELDELVERRSATGA